MLPFVSPAFAEDIQLSTYIDPIDGFTVDVPASWTLGEGSLGEKKQDRFSNAAGMQRVIGWVSPTTNNTSLAITVKTPGADYTGLGSFGKAEDFGENLVASIDRSFTSRSMFGSNKQPIVTANLISAKEVGGTDGNSQKYIIEYVTSKTDQPTRHVWTAVTFGESNNSTGYAIRRFYTITGSCRESDTDRVGPDLLKCIQSFRQ
jgi:hypothetical protein